MIQKLRQGFKQADLAEPNAQRSSPAPPAQEAWCGAYSVSGKSLIQRELFSLMANESVSRTTKILTIALLRDVDILVSLAIGDIPLSVRKDVLLHIDNLVFEAPFKKEKAAYLAPCLDEKELISLAAVIMEACKHDWCADCGEETVDALGAALRECTCLHEKILLEDIFVQLAYSRPDLNQRLYASTPEKFLSETVYAPPAITNMIKSPIKQSALCEGGGGVRTALSFYKNGDMDEIIFGCFRH